MRDFFLEKDWKTIAGPRAVVIRMNSPPHFTHRCGYVEATQGLLGVDYNEIERHIEVHGGITFSGSPPGFDSYWFGYDCAHSCDKTFFNPNGIERTLEYCVEECENLAKQLCNTPIDLFYLFKSIGRLSLDDHNKMLAFGVEDPSNYFVKKYFRILNGEEELTREE